MKQPVQLADEMATALALATENLVAAQRFCDRERGKLAKRETREARSEAAIWEAVRKYVTTCGGKP